MYALVYPSPGGESFDAHVVGADGAPFLHLTGYRTVAVGSGLDADRLKALQAAISLEAVAA
jgi:hypothetical protein